MEQRIAKIISIVFHPLLIPTYIIAVLINLPVYFALIIPFEAKWKIIFLVGITSAIFPVVLLIGMYRLNLLRSLSMDSKDERLYPYIATTVFFFLSYYMISQINIWVYSYCLLGAGLLSGLSLFINLFWKISAHMVSMGAALGAVVALQVLDSSMRLDWLMSSVVLLSGFVGFARLRVGTHTQSQIYLGYILGFAGMLLLFLFY
jgi:hypothetical protein